MSDELLVRHCSPTLAGLKTANMFSCSFENREDMTKSIRKLNRVLGRKGVRVLPLRFSGNQGLIYVYRPEKLSEDLSRNGAGCILSERGYCTDSTGRCIGHLMQRISEQKEFPHEIGLFLGYPVEDPRQIPALNLAYVGDTVYDLYVRAYLIHTHPETVHNLHLLSARMVCAQGQARAFFALEPQPVRSRKAASVVQINLFLMLVSSCKIYGNNIIHLIRAIFYYILCIYGKILRIRYAWISLPCLRAS